MSEIQWFAEARQVSELVFQARERDAAALMSEARRRTGLEDFGAEPLEEPLNRLLSAYRRERRLNLLGRIATRWDNLRLLTNRLILRERETADPAILARPVSAPVFIMGLPRSGTSFLHRLLALDPQLQALLAWQAVYPYPRHPAAGPRAGPERVQSEFSLFNRIAPRLRRVHPIDAWAPQECVDFTAHSFTSWRFDATYDVPAYRRWLRGATHLDAYRVHRRFLQHLAAPGPRTWVLKSPDHVFALEALRRVYPDARVVFSHRDPLKVLGSLANMTEVWRRPFARRIDRAALGRQVLEDWSEGAARMVGADAAGLWPAAQRADVHYRDLVRDPVGAVRSLYGRLGLPFRPALAAAIGEHVARHPNGGYGRNAYRLADYAIDPDAARASFRPYAARFGVEPEAPTG